MKDAETLTLPPSVHYSVWTRWMGYAACTWAVLFATLHYYWTLGGRGLFVDLTSNAVYVQQYGFFLLYMLTLSTLFVVAGLFPLSLIWHPRWIRPDLWEWSVVRVTCLLLTLFSIESVFFASNPLSIPEALAALVCVVGMGVTLSWPRHRVRPRWVLRTGTWIVGGGMTMYGSLYLGLLVYEMFRTSIQLDTSVFGYALLYGCYWLVGGILFVGTIWFAKRPSS